MDDYGLFSKEQYKEWGIDASGAECEKCGLYLKTITRKMKPSGEGRLKAMILGEGPGATEDQQGRQWVGEVGQFLADEIKARGLSLYRDFRLINAVNCRPHETKGGEDKNRAPNKKEIKCCKPYVDDVIKDFEPLFLLLAGKSAVESFYNGRFTQQEISLWRGLCIPDKMYNCWVLPIYHPSFAKRNEKDPIMMSTWKRDLDFALSCLKKPPPTFLNPYKYIELVKTFEYACEVLDYILETKPPVLCIDWETTGVKPYRKGHKIVAASFCFDDDVSYSMPLDHRTFWSAEQLGILLDKVKKILLEKSIMKVAHSMNFEDMWSRFVLGVVPENLSWCTMNGAHIMDAREGYSGYEKQSGLDVLAYIHFGIEGWKEKTDKYLVGERFNKVENAPLDELLSRNAIDSLITKWLYNIQVKHFAANPGLKKAREFNRRSLQSMANIQVVGINMDKKYYEEAAEKIVGSAEKQTKGEMGRIEAKLREYSGVKKFEEEVGRPIKFTAPEDIRILLYQIMGLKASKYTQTGLESADASAIALLNNDFAKDFTHWKKLSKVEGTYIAQFLREIDDDGRMRPFFNLHTTETFRGSSSKPNFQNIPVRDEEAKRISRSGIIPSPGNLLMDWDFSAMEFKIISCLSEDPALIAYCNDLSTDIHRDTAAELFVMRLKDIAKMIRFHSKNGFVFPECYGSYFRSCARNLWRDVMDIKANSGLTVKQHLYEVGVLQSRSPAAAYEEWEAHVKSVEKEWWGRYPRLKKWQEGRWADFIKKGYLEMPFGFRASGYLTRNEIVNYPVQGTAFHCLLWAINNIEDYFADERIRTPIIGQIHDCCIYDTYPEERNRVRQLSEWIATDLIRQENPWIIVPLQIEWEEAGIDRSWYEKIEVREAA